MSLPNVPMRMSELRSSCPASIEEQEKDDIEACSETQPEWNLSLTSNPGMFCILELILDHSASGLGSFWRFLDVVSPGACLSFAEIDFEVLERFQIRLVGIYGSKADIIRFLVSITVIDDSSDRTARLPIRSGLYICRASDSGNATRRMYVIYWPEDSTWDVDASPSVRRNCTIFMRYLMKICNKVAALVSEVPETKQPKGTVSICQGFESTSVELFVSGEHPRCNDHLKLPSPYLLLGETRQGFMTTKYLPTRHSIRTLDSFKISASLLQDALMNERLQISESISSKSLDYLVRLGLGKRFPDACNAWTKAFTAFKSLCQKETGIRKKSAETELIEARTQTEISIRFAVTDAVFSCYPSLDRGRCFMPLPTHVLGDESIGIQPCSKVTTIHPRLAASIADEVGSADCLNINEESFRKSKEKILRVLGLSKRLGIKTESHLTKLTHSVFNDGMRNFHSTLATIHREIATPANPSPKQTAIDRRNMLRESTNEASLVSDPDFITNLEGLKSTMPALQDAIAVARDQAQRYLEGIVDKLCKTLLDCMRQDGTKEQSKFEVDCITEQDLSDMARSLILMVNFLSRFCDSPHTLRIDSVGDDNLCDNHPDSFIISGERETLEEARLLFTIHPVHITEQDQRELQLDATKVPNPRFEASYSFELPMEFSVLYAQLLESDRLFLVLLDRSDNGYACLHHLNNIGSAIGCERSKIFHREKIGERPLLAFDETQAMLAIVSSDKLRLDVFVHDSNCGFKASRGPIDLNPWYSDGTTIQKVCLALGRDELLLVDSRAVARVFSLTTIQFRPASLNLRHVPIDVHSSPDGSYFLVVTTDGTCTSVVAYRWSTFGSSDGISLPITDWVGDGKFTISSLVHRSTIHLLKLDLSAHTCKSVALNITREVNEPIHEENHVSSRDPHLTFHHPVVDCHIDVWTHFPILPTVQRVSPHCRPSILFVADHNHPHYPAHFSDMVDAFERTSKKPTGDTLRTIQVSATTFDSFVAEFSPIEKWDNVLPFKLGEWVTEVLCLVPIHLALVRDDQFIPLRGGRCCPKAEESLLGADINHIVDSMSLGWYESIFKSDKPVRVVSSMGEQYVGKSYSLNQLVDASFPVSATRETEGIWMSVTPTEEELIVALDFQYMERSTWENTFVLFSTAISNLVLFHTKYTLGHDIAELFSSFQSNSILLDSIADPSLFQSTLVMIVRDIVSSKKTDIAREFSEQLQKVVKEQPDDNFISRFHGGKLNIMPWPPVESGNFYRPFPLLKRRLDHQVVTHKTASEFSHVIKILMAKIKAKNWETLAQTRTSYRVHRLLTLLPSALAFGVQSGELDMTELQIIDTSMPKDFSDTKAHFILPEIETSHAQAPEQAFEVLLAGWELFESRQMIPDTQWTKEFSDYLEDLAEIRTDHVRAWVDSNLVHHQDDPASTEKVRQALEEGVINLKTSIQLCMAPCASCQLLCIQSRSHQGIHDCKTTHVCARSCECCSEVGEFQLEGWQVKKCTMTAGHSGSHMCSLVLHLCGAPCKHLGQNGCLGRCVKLSEHEGADHHCGAVIHACSELSEHEGADHHCGAVIHACSEPCDLCRVSLADGSEHNCKGVCIGSVEIAHKSHQCSASYCPIPCQLCDRLCSSPNHLHALEEDAIHLCGKPHGCSQRCTVPGVCEIETTPESIETTFKGSECFQYTKYSQVARRLRCVKPIPPGQLQHEGLHDHSLDSEAVHFCQAKCPGCQYYCTLPMGHPQEHDTPHGSMSHARWSISGLSQTLDSDERWLSTNDKGTPMGCDMVCQALGRHVHIDYCRSNTPDECQANHEIQHLTKKISPEPDRPKDVLTHNLFWKRSGFRNPYSKKQQEEFAKCDAMCAGPEHSAFVEGNPALPSFCTLPLFHTPLSTRGAIKQGYVSGDGHQFMCRNPLATSFHIIFLIERSISMSKSDRILLDDSVASKKIRSRMNNRLGTVYGALHNFWTARKTACGLQCDANTVILVAEDTQIVCENDSLRSPDELLDLLLPNSPRGNNRFAEAFKVADTAISKWWDDARPPVVILLSDGIASVSDTVVQNMFKKAAQKGKGLSLHAILFGPKMHSVRMERMITVALDAQSKTPKLACAPSSFHEAQDSVQLSSAFLGIATSLRSSSERSTP